MGDSENPNTADAAAGATTQDAPQDPVQAAKDEAWLAQFRAETAAKVTQHNFDAAREEMAAAKAAGAERNYDLEKAAWAEKSAAESRALAAENERKAQEDAARHDEWELRRRQELQRAELADGVAAAARAAADAADKRSVAHVTEAMEIHAIYEQHQSEADLMQEQAVAAQRIATNEAKLSHPGDPVPGQEGEPPAP